MKRSNIIAVIAAVVILGGMIIWRETGHKTSPKSASAQAELEMASIANTAIHPLVSTKVSEVKIGNALSASGDMDSDGAPDTAAVLSETGAGRAKFVSVVLFRNVNGTPEYVNGMFLGDRDEVKSLAIKDRVLTIAFLSHAPKDFLNKPTEKRTLKLKLENGALVAAK